MPWITRPAAGDAFVIRGIGEYQRAGAAERRRAADRLRRRRRRHHPARRPPGSRGPRSRPTRSRCTARRGSGRRSRSRYAGTPGQLEIVGAGHAHLHQRRPADARPSPSAPSTTALREGFHYAYVGTRSSRRSDDARRARAARHAAGRRDRRRAASPPTTCAATLVRIVGGTGAGQYRYIRSNTRQHARASRRTGTSGRTREPVRDPGLPAPRRRRGDHRHPERQRARDDPTLTDAAADAARRPLRRDGADRRAAGRGTPCARSRRSPPARSRSTSADSGRRARRDQRIRRRRPRRPVDRRAPGLVADDDAPGVRITQSDGSTRLVEGAARLRRVHRRA